MNEINYLVKLGEQNMSHVILISRILFGLTTVITFAFLGVLGFILRELWKMRGERKKIEEHEQRLISLVEQVENMKNTIRDVSLKEKKIEITDNEIANLIKEKLNEKHRDFSINSIKDFIWKVDIKDIKIVKNVLNDRSLLDEISAEYLRTQGTNISRNELLSYAYEMKIKKKKLKEVVPQEKIGLRRWLDI